MQFYPGDLVRYDGGRAAHTAGDWYVIGRAPNQSRETYLCHCSAGVGDQMRMTRRELHADNLSLLLRPSFATDMKVMHDDAPATVISDGFASVRVRTSEGVTNVPRDVLAAENVNALRSQLAA